MLGWIAPVALSAFGLAAPFATAIAADLYQASAFVTGQGEENRASGFATALGEVLVKVSGEPRLRIDRRVSALAGHAVEFVTGFTYRDRMAGIPVHDEQGTRERPYDLTVMFDREKIDDALRQLGSRPWAEPRPTIVVLVSVRNGDVTYVLSRDGPRGRDLRDALATEADRLGMTVVLPVEADAREPEHIRAAALEGTLTWDDAALGWAASWRLTANGQTEGWSINGVSFDKAFRSGIGGAAQILSGNGPPN